MSATQHFNNSRDDIFFAPDKDAHSYVSSIFQAILWIGAALLLAFFMLGFSFTWPTPNQRPPETQAPKTQEKSATQTNNQLPDFSEEEQERKDGRQMSGVYRFFYMAFSGIEDGIDDNPQNLNNVENLDQLNIKTEPQSNGVYLSGAKPNINTVKMASAQKRPPQQQSQNQQPEQNTTESDVNLNYFNGKILDFEGNIAGDISAIKVKNGEVEGYSFVLKDQLNPSGKNSEYTIQKDKVNIFQKDDVFFIQLNKEQTQALAAALFKNQPRTSQSDSQSLPQP